MATAKTDNDARFAVCPYLHQLQMDWLSMDADGFYCHGADGHTKMLHTSDGAALCSVADFSSCSEYRILEKRARRGGDSAVRL